MICGRNYANLEVAAKRLHEEFGKEFSISYCVADLTNKESAEFLLKKP